MGVPDLVVDALVDDVLRLEQALVDAQREATAYREVYLMALEQLAEKTRRSDTLERRVRQIMGIESWRPEGTDEWP